MRIAYTSDLHIDASERNFEAARLIAAKMARREPDVIVVAGDVGNTLHDLEKALGLFSPVAVPKFFVAGNHDLWCEGDGEACIDSREKHEGRISETCRRMGFADLSTEPVVVGDVGFVGSPGWYDYTLADPRLSLGEDDYWRGEYENEIWWDKRMALWPAASEVQGGADSGRLRDPAVCSEMLDSLRAQLQSASERAGCIVAVVHTLGFAATLPRSEPPYYLDAFTGSERIGELLLAHDKVIHCINGHKHLSGDWSLGRVQVHRRPLGRVETDTPLGVYVERSVGLIEF